MPRPVALSIDDDAVVRGPFDEQPDRIGRRERRQPVPVFPRHAERLPTGCHDPKPWAVDQQTMDDLGDRRHDVLTVVEHDQPVRGREQVDHSVERFAVRSDHTRDTLIGLRETDRRGKRSDDGITIVERCELGPS